jgi:hypothetical protein
VKIGYAARWNEPGASLSMLDCCCVKKAHGDVPVEWTAFNLQQIFICGNWHESGDNRNDETFLTIIHAGNEEDPPIFTRLWGMLTFSGYLSGK